MRILVITRFICAVGFLVSAMLFLPIFIGFYYHEDVTKFTYFALFLLFLNAFLFYLTKNAPKNMTTKEGVLSVSLIWILLGIQGGIPFVLLTDVSFISGFFEAISGFTTTGASVFTDIEALPKSILFLRSLSQWLGGLGMVVLSIGLLSLISPSGSINLFKAESTGISLEKHLPKISSTALSLWLIYLSLTITNILLLLIFGLDWFDAINHAFCTISTGGFSTKNASMGFYENPAILWTTILFMLLGGTNFLIHYRVVHASFKCLKSEEFKTYVLVFIILSLALTFVHFKSADFNDFFHILTHSAFTIASVMTTTGFVTIDYETWGHVAIMLVFIGMLSSAMAGSTGGGVKMVRYIVFFKNISLEIKRILHPTALNAIYINKKMLSQNIISGVFGFFSLFILTVLAVMIYLFAVGYDELTAISTALAAVGNIGPGFGLSGPAQNYSNFTDIDKIVLLIGMIIGRLECYTILMLFTKSFWKKF